MTQDRKSLYQDEDFSRFWNERAGPQGEPYKRHVLDPVLMELSGSLNGRSVLEMGCGNGYLGPTFVKAGVSELVLMDISEHNIGYASQLNTDPLVNFLVHDATVPWPLAAESFDVVYSNMMLNEVEDIITPLVQAFRVLKPQGQLLFSVTHPAWDLFVYAQHLAGKPMEKMKGLGGYFNRGMARYIMGAQSKTRPDVGEKYAVDFEVEHYQRPLSDFFAALKNAGFVVTDMIEPELTPALLAENPRFQEYAELPVGLVFRAVKP